MIFPPQKKGKLIKRKQHQNRDQQTATGKDWFH